MHALEHTYWNAGELCQQDHASWTGTAVPSAVGAQQADVTAGNVTRRTGIGNCEVKHIYESLLLCIIIVEHYYGPEWRVGRWAGAIQGLSETGNDVGQV